MLLEAAPVVPVGGGLIIVLPTVEAGGVSGNAGGVSGNVVVVVAEGDDNTDDVIGLVEVGEEVAAAVVAVVVVVVTVRVFTSGLVFGL